MVFNQKEIDLLNAAYQVFVGRTHIFQIFKPSEWQNTGIENWVQTEYIVGLIDRDYEVTTEGKVKRGCDIIVKNKERIVAIGETGLDYWYTKEREWQEKQKQWFIQLIDLAKELNKPLIIHSREAFEDTIEILENQDAKKVMLHMWGDRKLLNKILENGYYISMNTIILRSKGYRKVVRDCPLERLMLETDAPWLSPKKLMDGIGARNDPTSIKIVAEKVADIKKISFNEVWQKCGENAINFFDLDMS